MSASKEKSILIVDDHVGIRSMLEVMFKEEGYITYTASDGSNAIELVQKHYPDVILMDLRMPGMGGMEALVQVRKISTDSKVVMMTAFGEKEIESYALKKGAVGFFYKPFDLNDIKDFVEELYKKDMDECANLA
ncbi:two-component system response regulator (stage 0 sporulation protein F) [Desulfitispora alkaliphila]|uniref:response regulator n=1 Tax=Desulfitispora alkaliphila TaxID=622674 RepID=UPI003D1938DE